MSDSDTIALASDHAGYALKELLKRDLEADGYEVLDLGVHGDGRAADYPLYAHRLARALRRGEAARGVLICGSGLGMSMTANRHRGIRAALCHDVSSARLARRHNDANVLSLGGRLTGVETARDCLRCFLKTPFEGGRHGRRVALMETKDASADDASDASDASASGRSATLEDREFSR